MGGEASSPDKKPPNGTSANPSAFQKKNLNGTHLLFKAETSRKKKAHRDLPLFQINH